MALEIDLLAVVGREDPAGEVIAATAPAWSGFLAPVGIGCDEDPDALPQERVDRVVSPIAGISQRDPDRFGYPRLLDPGDGEFDHWLQTGGVQ